MNPFQQHGAFSWCELITSDPEAAQTFYGELLGWKLKSGDVGDMSYTVIEVAGKEVGGIAPPPPSSPNCRPCGGRTSR